MAALWTRSFDKKLRHFADQRISLDLDDGAKVNEIFPPQDLTAWVKSPEQSLELDVHGEDGLFSCKLIISHNSEIKKQRIDLEHLLFDGKPLFEFKQGEVQLYHDDHKPGPKYSFDRSVSALATIVSMPDNKKLTWFKEWAEKLFIVSWVAWGRTTLIG